MKLINADALKTAIGGKPLWMVRQKRPDGQEIVSAGYSSDLIMHEIEAAPEVDAVQVVRCRECKFADEDVRGVVYCRPLNCVRNGKGFCSYGVRKEEI